MCEVDKCEETVRIEELSSGTVLEMLPEMGGIPGLMDTAVVELQSVVEEEPRVRGAVSWLAVGLVEALETGLRVE